MRIWICPACGFIYDEAAGCPEAGITPGTSWADVPDDWLCPDCWEPKASFELELLRA